jgi:hypothetical protein
MDGVVPGNTYDTALADEDADASLALVIGNALSWRPEAP